MTNQDGEKVFDQDYMPFGGDLPKPGQLEVQNETNESYKFTGQKQVASIGLYYYGARYYDPAVGRFTRQDSYRGELDNPQTQHLYVYVLNNPLRYTDPTGNIYVDLDIEELRQYGKLGELETLSVGQNQILGKTVTVQKGDTLSEIVSNIYGTSSWRDTGNISKFAAGINSLRNENLIHPGQKLFMPDLNKTMYDYGKLRSAGVIENGKVNISKIQGETNWKAYGQVLAERSLSAAKGGAIVTAGERVFKAGKYVSRYAQNGPTMTALTKGIGRSIAEMPKSYLKNSAKVFGSPLSTNALIDGTLGKGAETFVKSTGSKAFKLGASSSVMAISAVFAYTQPAGGSLKDAYGLDKYSKYGIYKDKINSGYGYDPSAVQYLNTVWADEKSEK